MRSEVKLEFFFLAFFSSPATYIECIEFWDIFSCKVNIYIYMYSKRTIIPISSLVCTCTNKGVSINDLFLKPTWH